METPTGVDFFTAFGDFLGGFAAMARLDIEDQFFLDAMSVIESVGDQDKALGNALRFLRYAQEKHRKGKILSEDEFSARGFHESLIGVFAERVDGGIQAIGAKKHFGWLSKKVDAGSKGGRSKTEAKTKHLKQNQAKGSNTEASLSLSLSSSLTSTDTHKTIIAPAKPALVNVVSFFCDHWKAKNGVNPDIRGKEAGQLTKLAKDLGIDRACQIIKAYFSMPDPYFIKRGYDVSTMIMSLAAIKQFEANGKVVTKKVVEQIETQVDRIQGTDKRQRRDLDEMEAEREAMLAEANGLKAIGGQ